MLNLNSMLLFSENPQSLVDFYAKILEKEPDWKGEVGEFAGFQIGACHLVIGPHDKVTGKSQNPERIIFNFESEDVSGEFERIKGLGVEVIQEPYHPEEAKEMWLATFADPDGNYFQLASPMKM